MTRVFQVLFTIIWVTYRRFLTGGEPLVLGLMDIGVARNAYGRQRESFEAQLAAPAIDADPFRVAFIRAPVVTRVGQAVQVLATHGNAPVLLQEGRLLVSSFHPEITGYRGIHLYFSQIVRSVNTPRLADEDKGVP